MVEEELAPADKADAILEWLQHEGWKGQYPALVYGRMLEVLAAVRSGRVNFGTKERLWQAVRGFTDAILRQAREETQFRTGFNALPSTRIRRSDTTTLDQAFHFPKGTFSGMPDIDVGRIAGRVIFEVAPQFADIVPSEYYPKPAPQEGFSPEVFREIIREELKGPEPEERPRVEVRPPRPMVFRIGGEVLPTGPPLPPELEQEEPGILEKPEEPEKPEAPEEILKEVEMPPAAPLPENPQFPSPGMIARFSKPELEAIWRQWIALAKAGRPPPPELVTLARERWFRVFRIPAPPIEGAPAAEAPPPAPTPPAPAPPPRRPIEGFVNETTVEAPPRPEELAPAPPEVPGVVPTPAPSLPPPLPEYIPRDVDLTRAARVWNGLSEDARADLVLRLGITPDPALARLRTRVPWPAVTPSFRAELIRLIPEWAPAPAEGATTVERGQRQLGMAAGLAAAPVALAIRYEPRTLSDIVVSDRTPPVENPIPALAEAARLNRPPFFVVLYSPEGGLGKTAIARAFARDYFAARQPELIASGSQVLPLKPNGRIDAGWYIEISGAELGDAGARDRLRAFLSGRGGFGESTGGVSLKKVLVLDDVDKVPPALVNFLKTTLQAGRADVDPEVIARSNIIFATTNNLDLFIEPGGQRTPLGSRANIYRVWPLYDSQVLEALQLVATREGYDCPMATLDELARRSRGSLREGYNLLDEAITRGACRPIAR